MITKKEIRVFEKYVKRLMIKIDDLGDMESNGALCFIGDMFVKARTKNPRFVSSMPYSWSVEETARMLTNLDFSSFHLAMSLKIGDIVSEGRLLGKSDLWGEVDSYLTDLIDAFQDHDGESLIDPDGCVDMVRAVISSKMYIVLAALAFQSCVSFNKATIFSSPPVLDVNDKSDMGLFLDAIKEAVANDIGTDKMFRSWLHNYVGTSLETLLTGVSSEEEFSKKASAFMSEAVMLYNLSKTIDSIIPDMISDPRDPDFVNRVADIGIVSLSHPDEETGVEDIVKETLSGYFGYLSIFLIIGVGVNIGKVSSSEWKAVLTTFSRFREHCGL